MTLTIDLTDMTTPQELDEGLGRVAMLITALNPQPTGSRTTGEQR